MLQQGSEVPDHLPTMTRTGNQRQRLPRIVRISVGFMLLIAGVVGLVLPFLQGILMIIAGLAILRKDIPWVARQWDHWIVPSWKRWGSPAWERCRNWCRTRFRR